MCGLAASMLLVTSWSCSGGSPPASSLIVSGMPSEVIEPPTNSVATLSGPRPFTPTSPAKNVWMSPVMKATSRMSRPRTCSSSSRRSTP